jgi:hypothetical protein
MEHSQKAWSSNLYLNHALFKSRLYPDANHGNWQTDQIRQFYREKAAELDGSVALGFAAARMTQATLPAPRI